MTDGNKTAAATITSLTALGLAPAAHANIQVGHSLEGLVSVAPNSGFSSGDFLWDVDGNEQADLLLSLTASARSFGPTSTFAVASVKTVSNFDFRFLLDSTGSTFASLSASDVVGAGGRFGGDISRPGRRLFASTTSGNSPRVSPDFVNNSTIGFRFQRDGSTHYGVAEIYVSITAHSGAYAQFDLTNVRWNNLAGESIRGDAVAVPEPASVATGLGLLALGAAGLRSFRRQTRSAQVGKR